MEQELLKQKKRNLVKLLLERKILLEPEFLQALNCAEEPQKISELINQKLNPLQTIQSTENRGRVKVLFSYSPSPKKISVQDFISYFNARYDSIKRILQQRPQLINAVSVDKLKSKHEREAVAVIGMVSSKEDTKNGIMVTIEDPTGSIKIFFGKTKQAVFQEAQNIVLDEVVGVTGTTGTNIVFANELYYPEIPSIKELKKSPDEEYVVFISDIHVGSKQFLPDEFMKFISWLRGEVGNEKQKSMAAKVKYLFVTGDLVDGISVYPTQKDELDVYTYREQYVQFADYMKKVPSNIQIIIAPGNHDIVPIAEPQPVLPELYCKEIWEMPNVTMVSNPALVNVGAKEGFSGFDVLMYHGYSYNYYADVVESIRVQKPNISERAPFVMKLLLQKRHLAPTYDANPHLATDSDNLIIDRVPDVFVSGDVHKSAVFTYKGVITGIIGSCFQSQTSFQEKVGHVPDPGRVPVLNLKTREVTMLNFSQGDYQ